MASKGVKGAEGLGRGRRAAQSHGPKPGPALAWWGEEGAGQAATSGRAVPFGRGTRPAASLTCPPAGRVPGESAPRPPSGFLQPEARA